MSTAGVTVTYTLDANGSLTSAGLHEFEYDVANRLSKVRSAQNNEPVTARYLHNARGSVFSGASRAPTSSAYGIKCTTMGKVKRTMLAVPAVVIALIGAYLVIRIVASLLQGYPWKDMDWAQHGGTSIGDFLAASDIGKRQINRDGKDCVEYFSYKDGLPVKVVCSK
ncbi:hypothetical protein EZ313_02335 [Ramlibacter henchirensis]|uniref:RHS repeat protein n=1 Tax=Ramlibacter henchirensis TaxID=204072 RepID=A0A4Z0C3M9_9BURK|nr:hypothetical protein [Ramlibacter henchirensis]TFZ05532.1 hypothetical protein EZ313_02335 [Ramlibacter henchirensis]